MCRLFLFFHPSFLPSFTMSPFIIPLPSIVPSIQSHPFIHSSSRHPSILPALYSLLFSSTLFSSFITFLLSFLPFTFYLFSHYLPCYALNFCNFHFIFFTCTSACRYLYGVSPRYWSGGSITTEEP